MKHTKVIMRGLDASDLRGLKPGELAIQAVGRCAGESGGGRPWLDRGAPVMSEFGFPFFSLIDANVLRTNSAAINRLRPKCKRTPL